MLPGAIVKKVTLAALVSALAAPAGCGGATPVCDALVEKVQTCCNNALQAADQTECQMVLADAENAQSAASAIHTDCHSSAFTCIYK
jgi:hypothetical protein